MPQANTAVHGSACEAFTFEAKELTSKERRKDTTSLHARNNYNGLMCAIFSMHAAGIGNWLVTRSEDSWQKVFADQLDKVREGTH